MHYKFWKEFCWFLWSEFLTFNPLASELIIPLILVIHPLLLLKSPLGASKKAQLHVLQGQFAYRVEFRVFSATVHTSKLTANSFHERLFPPALPSFSAATWTFYIVTGDIQSVPHLPLTDWFTDVKSPLGPRAVRTALLEPHRLWKCWQIEYKKAAESFLMKIRELFLLSSPSTIVRITVMLAQTDLTLLEKCLQQLLLRGKKKVRN